MVIVELEKQLNLKNIFVLLISRKSLDSTLFELRLDQLLKCLCKSAFVVFKFCSLSANCGSLIEGGADRWTLEYFYCDFKDFLPIFDLTFLSNKNSFWAELYDAKGTKTSFLTCDEACHNEAQQTKKNYTFSCERWLFSCVIASRAAFFLYFVTHFKPSTVNKKLALTKFRTPDNQNSMLIKQHLHLFGYWDNNRSEPIFKAFLILLLSYLL